MHKMKLEIQLFMRHSNVIDFIVITHRHVGGIYKN